MRPPSKALQGAIMLSLAPAATAHSTWLEGSPNSPSPLATGEPDIELLQTIFHGPTINTSFPTHQETPWTVSLAVQTSARLARLSVGAYADPVNSEAREISTDPSWETCLAWARLPAVASHDDVDAGCRSQLSSECIVALQAVTKSGALCATGDDDNDDDPGPRWPEECKEVEEYPLMAFKTSFKEGQGRPMVVQEYFQDIEADEAEEDILDNLAESVWLVALGWQASRTSLRASQGAPDGQVVCSRLNDDDGFFAQRAQSIPDTSKWADENEDADSDTILELRDLHRRKGGGGKSGGSGSGKSKSSGSSKSKGTTSGGSTSKNGTDDSGAVSLGQAGSKGLVLAGVTGFVILYGLL